MPIGATDIQPVNFLDQYAKGLELSVAERALERQEVDRIKAANQQAALNEMYRAAMGPSGRVDTNALYGMLARQNMGGLIPGMQQAQADIAFKEGQAAKQRQDAETAFWTQSRAELATIPAGNQQAYAAWKTNLLRRAPWAAPLVADQLTDATKQQMLATADSVLPKGTTTEVGGIIVTTDPYTGKEIGSVDYSSAEQAARAAGRAVSNVNLPPGELAYEKTGGEAAFKADEAAFNAAETGALGLERDYEAINLLRSGKPSTGLTADLELQINRFKAALTKDKKAIESVSDTELLNAVLGQDVFTNIQALGIGARGLDTPAEREYLREVISGTKELNRESLIRMAEIRARIKERAIDKFNKRVESGELDRYFKVTNRQKRTVDKPQPPAAPAASGAGKSYATEAEANAAFKAGKLNRGDRVTIGGVSGTWK